MKCQNLFSGKNKKNLINLLSAELAQRVVKVKVPVTTAADHILYFFNIYFSEKIGLDILSELSAKQTIHMKYQTVFSLKVKKR